MPTPGELAVIVCTRNRAAMLAGALRSIAGAVPDDVEIVVVDSASDDWDTRDVAKGPRVVYVRSEVRGLSIARNMGLRATERPLVLFTDDDCIAVDGWIDPILARFADPAVGAVTGRMLDHSLVGGDEAPTAPRRFTRPIEGLDAGHGAVMAFRRELVLELGGFDHVLGAGRHLAGAEDLDMFCRVLDAGHAIVHDPACVIHHMNTREGDSYTALHLGYGLGLGALANKLVRRRFGIGAAMLAVLLKRTGGRALRDLRNPRKGAADRAMLRGIRQGFFAGARLRITGTTFIDEHPPEPTPVDERVDRDTGRTR
jgi:GT2 family glycosyltransferase